MIVYLDTSVLVRAYLPDESGHAEAVTLLENAEAALITGSWTRIEASSALVRAARASRGEIGPLLELLDSDLRPGGGSVTVVDASQAEIESIALQLVRSSGIRSMDAWHLACASLAFAELTESGERTVFATHNAEQAEVAATLGWATDFTP